MARPRLQLGAHRLVHLDLKGAPPRLQYLDQLFSVLHSWGCTGLLVEWEDTFPYTDRLREIGSYHSSDAPYSMQEAAYILRAAEENNLIVIQLIQSIGHMEYALKHDSWRSLREVPEYPSSMCPSHGNALPLVCEALTQALRLQTNAQYIHIGADEVWHMAHCSSCEKRALESPHGKASLFLEHVTSVACFLRENYPHLKILMWDDMLRNLNVETLLAYGMGSLVEPMVWHYNTMDTFSLTPELWERYQVFQDIWVASAFKGASGSCQIATPLQHHMSNQEGWMKELDLNSMRIKHIAGVVFTGWSRYDHYATLCELLPVALPSLVLSLHTWKSDIVDHTDATRQAVYTRSMNILGCELENGHSIPGASFPGWELYKSTHTFVNLRESYRNLINGDVIQTWLNPWQVRNSYTNPMQIRCILPATNEILSELNKVEELISHQMHLIFYPHTIEEWIGTNITTIRSTLLQVRENVERLLNVGCAAKPAVTYQSPG